MGPLNVNVELRLKYAKVQIWCRYIWGNGGWRL